MGLILHSFLLEIFIFLLSGLFYCYLFLRWKYNDLTSKGIPCTKPWENIRNIVMFFIKPAHMSEAYKTAYERFKGHKIFGAVLQPTQICVSDPDLVHEILIKEFSNFHDRGFKVDPETNPLEGHLFLVNGERWRALRNKLSPTFTSGKLKRMYPLMTDCGHQLVKGIEKRSAAGDVELVDLTGCFTADVIGSCAFGYELSCMDNPDSEFRRMGKRGLLPTSWELTKNLFRALFPETASRLKIQTMTPEVYDFFHAMVRGTFEERLRTGTKRNDFMQLLLELREKGHVDIDPREEDDDEEAFTNVSTPVESIQLTDKLLTAQAFIFFVAGFETTATTMTYALHLLSKNRDIQSRLRQEIRDIKRKHGDLSYAAIKEMTYLDACISETLRIYPPIPTLNRECTRDYTRNGVEIDKGTMVVIPVYSIQTDPEHFPDPERFDPERFAPGASIRPGTYLPFGDGPRICIGKRFALLEAKMGLAKILESFDVWPSVKTEEPIKPNPKSFLMTPASGLWVKFTKLSENP